MVETQVVQIPLKKLDDMICFEFLSCIHIGNINFNKKKFDERVNVIATDPNRYWVGMGDYADSITSGANQMADKRLNFLTIDRGYLTADEQYEFIREKFAPIAKKGLGLHEGNHDYVLEEKTGHQYVQELSKDLDMKYLGYAAFTRVKFTYKGKPVNQFVLFSGHGHYSGGQAGGNLNALQRLASSFEADAFVTAHTHNIIGNKTIKVGIDDQGHIVNYPKVFASSGSFLEGYVEGNLSYPEKNLCSAKKTGTITVGFRPNEGSFYTFE